jgi:hypothetical protein
LLFVVGRVVGAELRSNSSAAVLAELEQNLLGDCLQGVEHADATIGHAFEHRFSLAVKLGGEV